MVWGEGEVAKEFIARYDGKSTGSTKDAVLNWRGCAIKKILVNH